MTTAHFALLKNMPVFGAVDEDTLSFIVERSTPVTRDTGEYFFTHTDDATSMYVMGRGRVTVVREHEGKRYDLAELGPGDCFGEMALIECAPRSASVQALEPCEALEVGLDVLHGLYEYNLEQFVLVEMNLARELSRRLRFADEQLFNAKVAASQLGGNYRWYLV